MSTWKRTLLATAVAAALALLAGTRAHAAPSGGPCKADAEKYCADVPAGGGKRFFCLEKNFKNLAPACQEQVEKRRKQAAEHRASGKGFRGACASDIEKLCKDVPTGGGKVRECLKKNESKVSSDCKKALDTVK